MRTFVVLVMCLALCGCAASPAHAPVEYLDAQTAATITKTADAWTFARERPEIAVNVRDYLSLYAFEVNRAGARTTYLLAHAWSTVNAHDAPPTRAPELIIAADDRPILLRPLTQSLATLGVGEPIAPLRGSHERAWCYHVEREALAYLTNAQRVSAELRYDDSKSVYTPWRSARAAYAAFLRAAPSR